MSKKRISAIPSRETWGKLDDLDVKYAFNLYGGKSVAEIHHIFVRCPIERVAELRFVPWGVFSYYILWFTNFLTSDGSKGECDCASCFLHLVFEKARAEPQKFITLYPHLKAAVDTVAGRQEFYEANVNIYGLFSDYKQDIEAALASASK